MSTIDRLELYAIMAVECGFTPSQVREMSIEEIEAILERLKKRNEKN